MGVRRDGGIWGGDQQPTRHAEVHDPFRGGGWAHGGGLAERALSLAAGQICDGGLGRGAKPEDDVFADAFDGEDGAAFEAFGLARGRVFEGLALGAEPGIDDAITADAGVDAAGDGFDFGEFGHGLRIVP